MALDDPSTGLRDSALNDPTSNEQRSGQSQSAQQRPAHGHAMSNHDNSSFGDANGRHTSSSKQQQLRSPSPTPVQALPPPETASYDVILSNLATYSLLVFATIWGVLARLSLEWIGRFAAGQVFALVWAQIVGCLVMGIVTAKKAEIERIYAPLVAAIGTGFCGSLTTFSSWMYDVFAAFANIDTPTSGRFQGFLSGVAVTVVTISASFMALVFGSHLALAIPNVKRRARLEQSQGPQRWRHQFSISLGLASYLGAIFLLVFGPRSWRHQATFAIVFGPPGTVLRYELSRRLNLRVPGFPLGTFSANASSDLIFAVASIFQRRASVTSALSCAALRGLEDGFCGSLSTVSTFVVELRTLSIAQAYRYFVLSWGLGQLSMTLVLGSYLWSTDRGAVCTY